MFPDTHKYDDIIGLPHPTSASHPRMSALERAAQFSPFAALTGYDDAVKEAARLTDRRIEPDEYEKAALDERLQLLREHLDEEPPVVLTWFEPDGRKEGGAYREREAVVRRFDLVRARLVLTDGQEIPLEDLLKLEGKLFRALE